MDSVRCLTAAGIAEFGDYIRRLGVEGDLPPPRALLTDDAYSSASTIGEVLIEPRDFANRREFAEYINTRFLEAGVFVDVDEPGMWEWLSLYYFDAVSPVKKGGIRKPGVVGRHLMNDANARRRFRHLLRSPYMLFRRYDGGPNGELDLLLAHPLPVHGIPATHIGERTRLMESRGALEAASRLYADPAFKRPKQGYSDNDNGLRAYCRFINNLPECFNLEQLSADTVLALLPPEFRMWMDGGCDTKLDRETRQMFGALAEIDSSSHLCLVAKQLADLLQAVDSRTVTNRQDTVRSDLFRTAILGTYESRCAISRIGLSHSRGMDTALSEVEAAHIIPVSRGGRDLIQNGLALNRTVHWAFDHGMLWVDDHLRVRVAKEVETDCRNQWLMQFRGRPLTMPINDSHHPHPEALHWHAVNVGHADTHG